MPRANELEKFVHSGSCSFVSTATSLVPTIEIKYEGYDGFGSAYLLSSRTLFESIQGRLGSQKAITATSLDTNFACITIKSKELKGKKSN